MTPEPTRQFRPDTVSPVVVAFPGGRRAARGPGDAADLAAPRPDTVDLAKQPGRVDRLHAMLDA